MGTMATTVNFVYNRKGKLNSKGKSVVQFRLTHERKNYFLSTGIYLTPKQWDWDKQRVKRHENEIRFNVTLAEMESKAWDYIHSADDFHPENLIRLLKGEDVESPDKVIPYFWVIYGIEANRLSDSTVKQHKIMINYVRRYNKDLLFSDIDYNFKEAFQDWLFSQTTERGKPVSINYGGSILKTLRRYLTRAMKSGRLNINPFLGETINAEETRKDYLTKSELKKIEDLDVTDRRGYIPQSKDMFLFMCYTGIRFSDAVLLTDKHIIDDGTGLRLVKIMHKTRKQQIRIDLPLYIMFEGRPERLIKKYLERKRVYDELFSPFELNFNKTFNDHLKEFAKLTGINKNLSSHVARHTCAMMLLNEYKASFEIVQGVLGHKSVATTQKHYAKLLPRTLDSHLGNVFGK